MVHGPLEIVVQEVAKMRLPRVNGFVINLDNHAFLMKLVEGAWVANATLSKERKEVAEEIVKQLADEVLPVLNKYIPGKTWTVKWEPDADADPESLSSVISFRWDG